MGVLVNGLRLAVAVFAVYMLVDCRVDVLMWRGTGGGSWDLVCQQVKTCKPVRSRVRRC